MLALFREGVQAKNLMEKRSFWNFIELYVTLTTNFLLT